MRPIQKSAVSANQRSGDGIGNDKRFSYAITEQAPHPQPSDVGVGACIRLLRKQRGWTLVETSTQTGVARSTLSKIEADQMSPTVALLQKISHGLGVNVTELLGSKSVAPSGGRRSITRLGSGQLLEHDDSVNEVLCSELSNKRMLPFRATVPPHSANNVEKWYSHEGEEFIYVVEGTIILRSRLYEPSELRAGDCAYVDSNLEHIVVNPTDMPAIVLWIVSNN